MIKNYKNIGYGIITAIVERGSLIIISIIVANHFSVHDHAKFSYFIATTSMIAIITSMGFYISGIKIFNENRESDCEALQLWHVSTILSILIFTLFLMGPIEIIYADFTYEWWIFPVSILFILLNVVPSAGVVGLKLFRSSAIGSILLISILAIGTTASIIMSSITVAMATFICYWLAQYLVNYILLFFAVKINPFTRGIKIEKTWLQNILVESIPVFIITFYGAFSSWLMGAIILKTSTQYNYSTYIIGLQWYALILFIPGVASRVMMPNFMDDIYARNNTNKNLIDGLKFILFISLILTFLISLMSAYLISLYGKQYTSEKWLISIFTLSALAYAPVNLITNYAYAQKKQKVILSSFGIWFILTASICASFVYFNKEFTVYSAAIVQILTNTLLTLILIKKFLN